MTRRIVALAVLTAAIATLLFAVPLAIAVRRVDYGTEMSELERVALRAAVRVDAPVTADGAELVSADRDTQLGLYDAQGDRVAGVGPVRADSATRSALRHGQAAHASGGGLLVVSVPVASAERVTGAVRASEDAGALRRKLALTWLAMLVVGVLAVGLSALFARTAARRLARPLAALAERAQQLGHGDFGVRTAMTGISEIDRAGEALNATAGRLGELVRREREISANASHQLRTPLTGLRATLESALRDPHVDLRAAAVTAIDAADRLAGTIDELIVLAREPGPATPPQDLAQLVGPVLEPWRAVLAAQGRTLVVEESDAALSTSAVPAAVRQVLDVLLDNASRHGRGAVTVTLRASGPAAAVDVSDQGDELIGPPSDVFTRGVSHTGGAGIGLSMARDLAADQGGRLLLTRREPEPRFTLLVPRA